MGIMQKLFGTYSEKQIKKIMPLVNKIEALEDEFKNKADEELKKMTQILKDRLAAGQTLDDILPEAFATVREADWRVLGKRPFRVQLIGGIIIHQGRIAEMKTGEGKTLVATLPAYLNALSGKGVHVITVNDYLATRDCEEMGRVYNFLGLSCGLIIPGGKNAEKRAAYACDITYGTNNEFGFDYLRDNMVIYKEHMVQRGHAFAIVDEVDSILIDEARTPLIISGQGSKPTDIYEKADKFARGLRPYKIKEIDSKEDMDEKTAGYDYIIDEKAKTSVLAKAGIEKAEKFFGIENLSDPENSELAHHINQAIKAHGSMHIDEDYVVRDGEVIIVDTFTGRLMYGRRYSDGLHQAIEAKEGVTVEKESKTLATITFQNLFRMYEKLSGMTGTALTEDDEFREIYNLDVVEIPTNRPMIRKDQNDVVYKTMDMKFKAIIEQIKECQAKGQPVLVGTVSIERSEALSKKLTANGIKHVVLNAKYHEKEAEIVAQAGCPGAVTISTNMAGRGTDIMLGGNPEYMAKRDMRKMGIDEALIAMATGVAETSDEEVISARATFKELYNKYKEEIKPEADKVREAGGLFILGTERHESRRIDNQLRGRSGRQGDPGVSRFFLSLEDDLIRLFGASERLSAITARLGLDENTPIEARMLSNSIESAQKRIEANNFSRRKHVLTYDDVMNQQRQVIYKQRSEVLFENDIKEKIVDMIKQSVSNAFDSYLGGEEIRIDEFKNHYQGLITDSRDFKYTNEELASINLEEWKEELIQRALEIHASKDRLFDNTEGIPEGAMREVEKVILLQNVDKKWMEHLDNMDELKEYVGLNSYAQRDPVAMYRIQGADLFDQMIEDIREDTVRQILSVMPRARATERVQIAKPTSEGFADGKPSIVKKPAVSKKVGRNDPCPCGSGKKYKKCCGISDSSAD